MNFTLSEEQEMLKQMAGDFLTEKCPKTLVKELEQSEQGYSPELWREMADLGWMGLALPEEYGGGGMAFLDLAVLLEEMGRACLPGPFFSTVILGGLTILDFGNNEQKQEYLPPLIRGEKLFTLALTEPGRDGSHVDSINVTATPDDGGYVIEGSKLFVPDAHIADYLLCVARTPDGVGLFVVDARDPGITRTVLQTMANDKLCEVVLNRVRVPAANRLGQPGFTWDSVERLLERAAVARSCEIVGNLERVLEMTIDYAKDRKQFGRPIGSFQIMQHYCADMAIDVDSIRFGCYQAAWMLSEGLPCSREAATAKAWTGEASQRVISLAHQVHGAIGVTMDHELHYYTRRAKAAELSFGNADFYREVVAKEMGLVS